MMTPIGKEKKRYTGIKGWMGLRMCLFLLSTVSLHFIWCAEQCASSATTGTTTATSFPLLKTIEASQSRKLLKVSAEMILCTLCEDPRVIFLGYINPDDVSGFMCKNPTPNPEIDNYFIVTSAAPSEECMISDIILTLLVNLLEIPPKYHLLPAFSACPPPYTPEPVTTQPGPNCLFDPEQPPGCIPTTKYISKTFPFAIATQYIEHIKTEKTWKEARFTIQDLKRCLRGLSNTIDKLELKDKDRPAKEVAYFAAQKEIGSFFVLEALQLLFEVELLLAKNKTFERQTAVLKEILKQFASRKDNVIMCLKSICFVEFGESLAIPPSPKIDSWWIGVNLVDVAPCVVKYVISCFNHKGLMSLFVRGTSLECVFLVAQLEVSRPLYQFGLSNITVPDNLGEALRAHYLDMVTIKRMITSTIQTLNIPVWLCANILDMRGINIKGVFHLEDITIKTLQDCFMTPKVTRFFQCNKAKMMLIYVRETEKITTADFSFISRWIKNYVPFTLPTNFAYLESKRSPKLQKENRFNKMCLKNGYTRHKQVSYYRSHFE
ncbi:hypothetical protein NEDG_01584 [Nematocida displodere]|uniref:Uncharacterized protein n=1 Tax=Nematocida displodere TaxID=1805483 RepID=A0A177EI71_9MICR|nr:hypothetical protein NEDG_01584 [Nematocida displodere]